MPLYDYCCPQGHLFEQMAPIAERERQNCPACGLAQPLRAGDPPTKPQGSPSADP